MSFLLSPKDRFKITIEVVPPAGHESRDLLDKLKAVSHLPFDGFSVATNPVAKPRMSAMVFSHLIQKQVGKPAILHVTVRDHSRLGLTAELWGARALGIDTVIAVTGDPSAQDGHTTFVRDLDVYELISLARASGLTTGAVLDYRPEHNGLAQEILRLEKKAAAGCEFIVTQPIYDQKTADTICAAVEHIKVPIIMGILPLISFKHAAFLHQKVAGIAVPGHILHEMEMADAPVSTGVRQAGEILEIARKQFAGACIMPPFERFDILPEIF